MFSFQQNDHNYACRRIYIHYYLSKTCLIRKMFNPSTSPNLENAQFLPKHLKYIGPSYRNKKNRFTFHNLFAQLKLFLIDKKPCARPLVDKLRKDKIHNFLFVSFLSFTCWIIFKLQTNVL